MATELVDLRSDTLTRPTPSMRRAKKQDEVGDDVFGDDPTVNRLQAVLAERLGFEAGGVAVLGSIQPQPLENEPDGSIALEKIAAAIKPDDAHFARTRLAVLVTR